jgi:hypothetical protein
MSDKKYSTIQITFPAKDALRKKKNKGESYEEYLRRMRLI